MTTEFASSQVTERGPATGRIHGINHLFLIVDDLDVSVRFYRDVLGFRIVRTNRRRPHAGPGRRVEVTRTYIFDIGFGNDMLLGMYEVARESPCDDAGPEPSTAAQLWPGESVDLVNPTKMDHLAFNVDTHEDLVWFQDHLRSHGVTVTEISTRFEEQFGESIYFYDPNGIPLEIATFDWDNPRWNNKHEPSDARVWMRDLDPIPALRGE